MGVIKHNFNNLDKDISSLNYINKWLDPSWNIQAACDARI